MNKKQLIEMLEDVPDDTTICVLDLPDYDVVKIKPVSCYTYYRDNSIILKAGDTDND